MNRSVFATTALAALMGMTPNMVEVARAEVGTGTLSGVVRDAATQKPVADVVVTVTSPALQGEEMAVTGPNGDFRIMRLPPGEYTVRMDREQYKPYARSGIRVRSDVTLRLDTQILPEGLGEDIVVVARRPTVDVGSASTGTSIDAEFTRRVPVARPNAKGGSTRDIESVAASAPQAAGDTFGTSISGSTSPENNYVVDGMTVNDAGYGTLGLSLSTEFVKELNVITGGFLPEYGKSTGGVISAVTKSGSNEFRGGYWAFISPGAMVGPDKEIKREASTIDTQSTISDVYDFGVDIGGPIIKDDLWFYFGVGYSSVNWDYTRKLRRTVLGDDLTPIVDDDGFTRTEVLPGTEQEFGASSRMLQIFTKLTWRANENNRVNLSFVGTPRWSGGDGDFAIDSRDGTPEVGSILGPFDALATQRDTGAWGVNLKWNSDLVPNKLLLDTTVGWHHQTGGILPSDGSAVGSLNGLSGVPSVLWRRTPNADGTRLFHEITEFEQIPDPTLCAVPAGAPAGTQLCPLTNYLSGGPGFIDVEKMHRIGAKATLTWLAEAAGQHVVKVGAEVDYMSFNHNRGYSGRTAFREGLAGTSFTELRQYGYLTGPDEFIILDSLDISTTSWSVGGFLQDSWTITDGLTLNIGGRWDAQFLYGGDDQLFMSLPYQFAPRVGAIWDPTTKGRSKIFTNFALYYENVPLGIANRAGSGEPQIASVHAASVCDPSTEEGLQGCRDGEGRLVVNGPSSPDQQWILTGGGKTPVDPDLEAQSSWEFVLGGELDLGELADELRDLRSGLVYTKRWMNNVIEDMSRDEAYTYFVGNPGKGIASDFPEATRDYDAFTLYFMKDFSRHWMMQASYTLSWLKGNYAGLFRPETGQLDPNINSDFDLKSLTVNRDGYLPGDSRHQIKLFTAYEFVINECNLIQAGVAVRAASGGPTDFLGSHPLYGSDEVFILPRGSGERLPWFASIDLNVGYTFKPSERVSFTFTADIFNLFNFQAPVARNDRYTNADVDPLIDGTKDDLANVQYTDGSGALAETDINPNFGKVTAYQQPRTFRLGVRGSF